MGIKSAYLRRRANGMSSSDLAIRLVAMYLDDESYLRPASRLERKVSEGLQ